MVLILFTNMVVEAVSCKQQITYNNRPKSEVLINTKHLTEFNKLTIEQYNRGRRRRGKKKEK